MNNFRKDISENDEKIEKISKDMVQKSRKIDYLWSKYEKLDENNQENQKQVESQFTEINDEIGFLSNNLSETVEGLVEVMNVRKKLDDNFAKKASKIYETIDEVKNELADEFSLNSTNFVKSDELEQLKFDLLEDLHDENSKNIQQIDPEIIDRLEQKILAEINDVIFQNIESTIDQNLEAKLNSTTGTKFTDDEIEKSISEKVANLSKELNENLDQNVDQIISNIDQNLKDFAEITIKNLTDLNIRYLQSFDQYILQELEKLENNQTLANEEILNYLESSEFLAEEGKVGGLVRSIVDASIDDKDLEFYQMKENFTENYDILDVKIEKLQTEFMYLNSSAEQEISVLNQSLIESQAVIDSLNEQITKLFSRVKDLESNATKQNFYTAFENHHLTFGVISAIMNIHKKIIGLKIAKIGDEFLSRITPLFSLLPSLLIGQIQFDLYTFSLLKKVGHFRTLCPTKIQSLIDNSLIYCKWSKMLK